MHVIETMITPHQLDKACHLSLRIESGGAVVRIPGLESQGCEFDSHWVSIQATMGKLLT